ncbi:calcium activated cation channel [Phanerochaete sordida]|uniref:Calcium activated cation channel n=1 Tax=Phanerochaete sordida TaxID=48140 RepID=A0A9P3FY46_9APHY|nr:calcium activated cation channel [Phanerochaete sordida]
MVQPLIGMDTEDQASLTSIASVDPTPDTLTKLIRRLRALTLELLPIEVSPDAISDPTSRVITPQVIKAYIASAGDFVEALPYCLISARKEFMWDSNHNPADYGENLCRATACEVLARKIVHASPPDRITTIMTTRFTHKEVDGDVSDKNSALELAIDSHCTIFLSSNEAQEVVNDLWRGNLVQRLGEHHDIEFQPFHEAYTDSIWGHMDPDRIGVPRYQNIFRICVWVFFLFSYSQAVREPLDTIHRDHSDLDPWEIVMYVMALAFTLEDLQKVCKLLLFVSWRALGFWNFVSSSIDALLVAAFCLRMAGLSSHGEQYTQFRIKSFQVLSFVAPLIWMKLIPIFDGYKYVGTMQICVARMLQESGIFFGLLALLSIGFIQGLYALDAADGHTDHPIQVINLLVQALLQAPNYDRWSGFAPALLLYYLWNVATVLILLNILISLFSSAYEDVVEDAPAEYLAYFADKTISMIRAPDEYTYPAPFNLIEITLIAPWEYFISREAYRSVRPLTLFLPTLVCTAKLPPGFLLS